MIRKRQSIQEAGNAAPSPPRSGHEIRKVLETGLRKAGFHKTAKQLMRCCASAIPTCKHLVFHETTDGRRHLGGLMHCGRHLCPLCQPYHAGARRAGHLALADANWSAGNHFLFTPSTQHNCGERWGDQKAAFKMVASKVQRCRYWQQSVLGFVRRDETTWNEQQGHHFHQHFVLTLRPGVDSLAFSEWLQRFWTRMMEEAGRTCHWGAGSRGWWKSLSTVEDLHKTISYLTKRLKTEDWPPSVFDEIWAASKRHRWYGAGGIWKARQEAMEARETAVPEAEATLAAIAWIDRVDWTKLRRVDRAEIQLVAATWRMDPTHFLAWLGEKLSALGCPLHPGAPPGNGTVAPSSTAGG